MALMRACSAWPCGVWIDGEQADRAGRHQLRLAALEPHVRVRAGRRARGLAHGRLRRRPARTTTTTLLAAVTPAARRPAARRGQPGQRRAGAGHAGRAQAARQPAGARPRGSRTGRRGHGAAARPGGRAAGPVRVGLFTGISGAQLTGLSEDTDGGAAGPAGDGAGGPGGRRRRGDRVGPAGTVTLALGVPPAAAARHHSREGPATSGVTRPEPAQPVFARYWLHGKGPAPAGNLPGRRAPVATRALGPGRRVRNGRLRLTVACGPEGRLGRRAGCAGRAGAGGWPGAGRAAALRPAAARPRRVGADRPRRAGRGTRARSFVAARIT